MSAHNQKSITHTNPRSGDLRVFKFGGSSQGTPERLRSVLGRIEYERARSPLAVVVSAQGDTTDWLLEAAALAGAGELEGAAARVEQVRALALRNVRGVAEPDHHGALERVVGEVLAPLSPVLLGMSLLREQTAQATDLVLSFGERLSAQLVSALLSLRGVPATPVDARDWAVTDARFGDATIDWPATEENLSRHAGELWREGLTIHTGFLGRTRDGRTTTLGRNGSDYTATLLARGLGAAEVAICTDVPGVMTGDPNLVPDAYPVPHLSYLEALELANYGTRMFHPRTMLPLIESGIPMTIQSTLDPQAPGTRIDREGSGASDRPTCVTSLEQLALIEVRARALERPATLGRHVIEAVDDAGITVWMANQASQGQSIALAVPLGDAEEAAQTIERALNTALGEGIATPIQTTAPVTLLSLVAERLGDDVGAARALFDALDTIGAPVLASAQGGRSRSISCVIPACDTAVAVRTVHAAFNFAHQQVSVALFGCGVVGGELLRQLHSEREALRADHDVALDLVALVDSRAILTTTGALPAHPELPASLRGQAPLPEGATRRPHTHAQRLALLDDLARRPLPVLVDATAADGNAPLFLEALQRGIHVVTANKKPLVVAQEQYHALRLAARRGHRDLRYETTVGASLPVIETLKNLRRTGDRVRRVEGALSGTLGFLINETSAGVPLSVAVQEAIARGYAEPQPQDDLAGTDVARKALILARELGLELALEDVRVEPLVPADLLEIRDVPEFLIALRGLDGDFAQTIQNAHARGHALRYLAIIDPEAPRGEQVRVGPVEVAQDHPSTRLRGTEAFIAFTTARYDTYPLIVQGPGAGGAVTAAGVLADILSTARRLHHATIRA